MQQTRNIHRIPQAIEGGWAPTGNVRRTHAKAIQYEVVCACGRTGFVAARRNGVLRTRKCHTCSTSENGRKNIKHGYKRRLANTTPTYKAWAGMRNRCFSPTNKAYDYYGGRGITVCERWATFDVFLADMGERPQGTSLDRIDSNGNYEPSNCRWATPTQQTRGRTNTVLIEFRGKTLPLVEHANAMGLDYGIVWQRMFKSGWDIERALTTPSRKWRRRTNNADGIRSR